MTPQELKNSILQLAIQGKLVEQRPEEGTAEELFARIQEEKQRLVAEKKIKKEKPLPEITEDEKPFDIPENWIWMRVGDCGSWGSGATPSRANSEYYGGKIPWLKTGDLNDGIISEIPEHITERALEKTSVRLNPVGSVLMAMYGATIGKLGILGIEATTNQACCACIPYGGVYNKFLFYFLMASRTVFIKMGEGGAQPNISKEKIVNTLIPLPPFVEQKRIVAKIEELLPYIDRYEQVWRKLEQFNSRFPEDMKKSLLQYAIQGKLVDQRPEEGTAEELFDQIQQEKQRLIAEKKIKKEKPLPEITDDEKPFELPESWMWVRLGDITSKLTDGSHNPPPNTRKGYPVISAKNVKDGLITFENVDRFTDDEGFKKENSRTNIIKGDIIMGIIGGSIGNVAIYTHDIKVIAQRSIAIIKFLIEPDYSKFLLESPLIQNDLMVSTSGSAQGGVYLGTLKNLPIPLPPLAEQKRIVEKLKVLLPLCRKLRKT